MLLLAIRRDMSRYSKDRVVIVYWKVSINASCLPWQRPHLDGPEDHMPGGINKSPHSLISFPQSLGDHFRSWYLHRCVCGVNISVIILSQPPRYRRNTASAGKGLDNEKSQSGCPLRTVGPTAKNNPFDTGIILISYHRERKNSSVRTFKSYYLLIGTCEPFL